MDTSKIFQLRNLLIVLPLSIFIMVPLISQSLDDVQREVVVYFQPDVFEFPASSRTSVTPDNTEIHSEDLKNAIKWFNVERISRAFPDFEEADTVRTREDGVTIRAPNFHRIFVLNVGSKSDVDSAVTAFSKIEGVVYAIPNWDESARLESDPTYHLQWHLNNTAQNSGVPGSDISAEAAWQIYTGSPSIKIGIFDTGVDLGHEEFAGKISGDDIDTWGTEPYWSHGTHVAGIAAARANNDKGGRGVDWNAQIVSKQIND